MLKAVIEAEKTGSIPLNSILLFTSEDFEMLKRDMEIAGKQLGGGRGG
jgi:hypothetical protein